MVLDTTSATNGDIAKMRSKRLLTKSPVQCLQFSYYIRNAVADTPLAYVLLCYVIWALFYEWIAI